MDEWEREHAAINSYKCWELAIAELRKRRLEELAMKDLTPNKCAPLHCPAVYELEDGRLLIIGKRGDVIPAQSEPLEINIGPDEWPIIISRDLLANVLK